jgi:hypothetical protein
VSNFFYFGFNPRAAAGDEVLGLAIGRLYAGIYRPGYFPWYKNVCIGLTDANGCID